VKLCESCGEDEVLWLDTTSGDPAPEIETLCLGCYHNYPWRGLCSKCGWGRWLNNDHKCWACTCNDVKMCECCGQKEAVDYGVQCGDCDSKYYQQTTCDGCDKLGWVDYHDKCWACNNPPINDDTPFGRFCTELVDKFDGESFSTAVDFWAESCYTDIDELVQDSKGGSYSEVVHRGFRLAFNFCYAAWKAKQGEI
jgi:hypothetical protein